MGCRKQEVVGTAPLDTVSFHASAGTRSRRAGVAALCGLFLSTYLLLASPLHTVIPSARSVVVFVPALVGIGFLVSGRLFGLVLEPARTSRRIVRASVVVTLLLAVALCAALRLKSLWLSGGGMARIEARVLPAALLDTAASAASPPSSSTPHPARSPQARPWLEIACMVTIEESIKLLPVFFLIRRRRSIRTAPEAMWAGALAGLCFGMVEAVNHAFFLYARLASPATTYLVRALVMAPSHGIGAAIACGVAFAFAQWRTGEEGRTPSWGDMLGGFFAAVLMHASHNGLQAVLGPSAQIATVFLPLLLLYGLSRGMVQPASAGAAGARALYNGRP